jgi:EAL domain-containing protein (putative c-di-GMP-specific phosphodiesterase class I)
MAAWVKRRVELEDELEAALDGEQFDLELQPQVSILTGELVGAEALTRWRHPTLGDIPPSTFIPLAEETGRIPRLGHWVARRACELGAEWEKKHGVEVPLSVNVSIRQIQAGTLVATVEEALAASGLRPELLRLEITANHAGRHADKVHQCVEALAKLGVGFTIDDFGTGYGSLDYLVRSPIRALKIDRRFIAGLPDDRVSASIVSAGIGLGRGLGLEVIASGVEVPEQLEFLRRHRCELAQGYLLSPPLSRKTFEALLIEGRLAPIAPALAEQSEERTAF